MDGEAQIFTDDRSFYLEYKDLLCEGHFLSESAFNAISSQTIDIQRGTYCGISNNEETSTYLLNLEATKLTNPYTMQSIPTQFAGFVHFNDLTDRIGFYVLDDVDFALISQNITSEWQGNLLLFNSDGIDQYDFVNNLYHTIVNAYDKDYLMKSYYHENRIDDLANALNSNSPQNPSDEIDSYELPHPDTSTFRAYWNYMPKFRMLDEQDFACTFAVYLSLFVLIAIICFTITLTMCFIRCQTLVLNNRYIFDDLKRLGASSAFLTQELKNQCSKVFKVPALVGMSVTYLLYILLMYANDGGWQPSDLQGLSICFILLLLLAFIFYIIYLQTIKAVKKQLEIE